jgi:hypothetical protein
MMDVAPPPPLQMLAMPYFALWCLQIHTYTLLEYIDEVQYDSGSGHAKWVA